ncbi:adenylate/guanylate cyclase domain-containing protein [Candidatus Ferrigenium straubiae]|jgi:class 3 adenylate cyclase|uniref:adenylate/guanylate cyclase domain-containing protein n=1 Tax=Candidatus Ferrigenium straubiae TaxID=2919506 RepID=UPI003F4AECDE
MSLPDKLRRYSHPIGFLIVLALGLALHLNRAWSPLELFVLDRQFTLLREHPQPLANDVVVVGIDEATFKQFREPFALWHPHLGKFFQAMAGARPSVVGMDIVLPDRSYQFLAPGYDQALMQGLIAMRGTVPVVLSQSLDDQGNVRPIFPPFVAVAGVDAMAFPLVCLDRDGVPRRLDGAECANRSRGMTLSEAMSAKLGARHAWSGMIDYSLGAAIQYIPFTQVLNWYEQGDTEQLARVFQGRPVLLGVILPFSDRMQLPVPLAGWEPENRRLPGVLIHAQALRSMLNRGPVATVHPSMLLLLALLPAAFWWGRSAWPKVAALFAFSLAVLAISTLRLWQGQFLPPVDAIGMAWIAFTGRAAFDSMRQYREKRFLKQAFGGHVSPVVMNEILAGNVQLGAGKRRRVCVLFADIRGFTARSEQTTPEAIIELLNGYFAQMTEAIHKHGGVVDKFIGDGLMAFFGAPQSIEHPERKALEAAQEMLLRLHRYNQSLTGQGVEPIAIGIGIHAGDVILGYIGSEARHEYTAIGDTVNAASRLEGMTKTLGYPVVCSSAVAGAVKGSTELVDLGEHSVRGHAPMHLFGWKPAILDRLG